MKKFTLVFLVVAVSMGFAKVKKEKSHNQVMVASPKVSSLESVKADLALELKNNKNADVKKFMDDRKYILFEDAFAQRASKGLNEHLEYPALLCPSSSLKAFNPDYGKKRQSRSEYNKKVQDYIAAGNCVAIVQEKKENEPGVEIYIMQGKSYLGNDGQIFMDFPSASERNSDTFVGTATEIKVFN